MNLKVTKEWLDANPTAVFVFGDNLERKGTGGAAILRGHPQTYGFITKKTPKHDSEAYYTPEEYRSVFLHEWTLLCRELALNPDKTYYISKLGAGLANKYFIWETVIEGNLKYFAEVFDNAVILDW